jgi:hypothetical protein
MWLSITLGIVGALVPWAVFAFQKVREMNYMNTSAGESASDLHADDEIVDFGKTLTDNYSTLEPLSGPPTGWHAFWMEDSQYVVASAIMLPTAGGLPWLIYLILAGVKALVAAVKREQNTRPKLLDVRQRIVVWGVAIVLTVISFAHGIRFSYRQDSIWWLAIIPVFLIGAATFLHVMQRKE